MRDVAESRADPLPQQRGRERLIGLARVAIAESGTGGGDGLTRPVGMPFYTLCGLPGPSVKGYSEYTDGITDCLNIADYAALSRTPMALPIGPASLVRLCAAARAGIENVIGEFGGSCWG